MSNIISLEGPKGSGKSTIADLLVNKGYQLNKYDGGRLMTNADLETTVKTVFDRGSLSFIIYGFLNQAYLRLDRQTDDFSTMSFVTWTPMPLDKLERVIDVSEYYVVLYSSDTQLLFDRIYKRDKETGKGATQDEFKELEKSNDMYKLYGQFLSKYYDKVLHVDIADEEQVKRLYEKLGIEK